jgi:hypothetical protein
MKPEDSKHPQHPWLPPEFFENRRKFTPEQLAPYAGKHVAWSWQGDRILDSAATEEELRRRLAEAGFDPQMVVYTFIDDL